VNTSHADIQALIATKRAELAALEVAVRVLWPNGDTTSVNGHAPTPTAKPARRVAPGPPRPKQMRLKPASDQSGLERDVLAVLDKSQEAAEGRRSLRGHSRHG